MYLKLSLLKRFIKISILSIFTLTFCVQCLSDPSTQISFQACTQNCQRPLQATYPSDSVCLIIQYYNEQEGGYERGPKKPYFASIENKQIIAPVDIFQTDEYTHADISFFIHEQNLKQNGNCGELDLGSQCDLAAGCIMKVNITQIEVDQQGILAFSSGFCRDEDQICNQ